MRVVGIDQQRQTGEFDYEGGSVDKVDTYKVSINAGTDTRDKVLTFIGEVPTPQEIYLALVQTSGRQDAIRAFQVESQVFKHNPSRGPLILYKYVVAGTVIMTIAISRGNPVFIVG